MKYTKENVTAVLIKHLNEPCVKSMGIPRACELVAIKMFIDKIIENEDATIIRSAVSNLHNEGFFKFDE